MKTNRLLAAALALVLVVSPGFAHASLIGDEVTISINGVFPNNPTMATVGAGIEATFVGFNGLCSPPGETVDVDVGDSQIWITLADAVNIPFFMCDQNDVLLDPVIITIEDMDWVNQAGEVIGISIHPNGCVGGTTAVVLGPHSVQMTFPGQIFSSLTECHFDLEVQHVVGGGLLPIDNTVLLLAGLQASAIWMLPVLAGTAGATAFYLKTRKN
jgi:hypothetical protein